MVGLVNTALGFAIIFSLFNLVSLSYAASTLIGYVLGNICGYFLNRHFAFRDRSTFIESYWKYALVFLGSYGLSYYGGLAVVAMADPWIANLGITPLVVRNLPIVTGAVIYVVVNFLGNSYLTFTKRSAD